MEAWLGNIIEELALLMEKNMWFAPVLCFLAGLVTSFTPCSLSVIPIALKYAEENPDNKKYNTLKISAAMAGGMAVTFSVFGIIASMLVHFMHEMIHWWSYGIGVLMIVMSLQIFGIFKKDSFGGKCNHEKGEHHHHDESCKKCGSQKRIGRGYVGAFFTGAAGGVFASHCGIPMMMALLVMVAKADFSYVYGVLLIILYVAGHSVLLILTGAGYDLAMEHFYTKSHHRMGGLQRILFGSIVLAIGVMLFL